MHPSLVLPRLAVEGELLLRAAERAGWDAAVPGLEWNVRTVVTHTGAVHRWVTDLVGRALPTNETGGSSAFWPAHLGDRDLPEWFSEGLTGLLAALAAAPPDLRCYAFLHDVPPRQFWIRRQLHETIIHRGDVEGAAGKAVTAVSPDVAQDGLLELVGGFAIERAFASSRTGRLLLAATDGPSWMVTFGGPRTRTAAGVASDTPTDAVVRGTSEQLYRWAWNRPAPEVQEEGDPDVLACWRQVRVV